MVRPIEDIVKDYIWRMGDIKESMLGIRGDRLIDSHKKALLFSLLETMSKGVYGDKYKKNGERFEFFIQEFCEWDNSERISLQQLAYLLLKTDEGVLTDLKEYTFTKLSQYPKSQPVPFSKDPHIDEVQSFLNTNTLLPKVKLRYLKHVNLLWRYRNALVHEARSIGADRLFDFEAEPHYIPYFEMPKDNKEERSEYWEIYYPLEFFIKIIDTAISNIEPYLIENNINPFINYEFETLWIKIR